MKNLQNQIDQSIQNSKAGKNVQEAVELLSNISPIYANGAVQLFYQPLTNGRSKIDFVIKSAGQLYLIGASESPADRPNHIWSVNDIISEFNHHASRNVEKLSELLGK